jgi:hypothetical protein
MRSTLNSRLSPTHTKRRGFEFARDPYACFCVTRTVAKSAIFFISNVFNILETRASLRATFPAAGGKKFLAPAAL